MKGKITITPKVVQLESDPEMRRYFDAFAEELEIPVDLARPGLVLIEADPWLFDLTPTHFAIGFAERLDDEIADFEITIKRISR